MSSKKVLSVDTKVSINGTGCIGVVKSVFSMSHDNKWYHVVADLKGEPLGDYKLEQLTVIN